MKSRCLTVSAAALLATAGLAQAQFTEGFEDINTLPGAGWFQQNNSTTLGLTSWFQGNVAVFPAFAGAGYIGANFNNTTGLGTISNWLVSPEVSLTNGATLTFYTRTVDAPFFPDRLQVRMNKANTGTNVGTFPTDVGDFSDLLLDINPTYIAAAYPAVWTQQVATVSGVAGTVNGRLAFRYFVENAGPSGSNSDYIGIDDAVYAVVGVPTGRCCFANGSCQVLTASACSSGGGAYAGDGTDCVVNVCPQPPTGACCAISGACSILTQAQCVASGGTYNGDGTSCTPNNCPAPPPGGDVYAIDVRGGAPTARPFIKFPVNSPAYNIQGNLAPTAFAMDFDASGANLYAITFVAAGAHELGTIDQTTGAFTPIATVTGAAGTEANLGGMTFDASTNTMYVLGTNAGFSNLYTINLATGNTTLVAPITGLPAGFILIDIAMNNAGTLLVGHEIGLDQMWSINKTTGVATLLGATGLNANFAQGMDFDPVTGNLYAAIYVGGGVGSFVRVDTTTGACTVLANTQPWTPIGPEMEMAIKATTVACYANCDGSTGAPLLTANDFQCFLNKYAANDTYANCDGSTGAPLLTANDFQCFLNKYAAGCS